MQQFLVNYVARGYTGVSPIEQRITNASYPRVGLLGRAPCVGRDKHSIIMLVIPKLRGTGFEGRSFCKVSHIRTLLPVESNLIGRHIAGTDSRQKIGHLMRSPRNMLNNIIKFLTLNNRRSKRTKRLSFVLQILEHNLICEESELATNELLAVIRHSPRSSRGFELRPAQVLH